jgi:hypothetical protein
MVSCCVLVFWCSGVLVFWRIGWTQAFEFAANISVSANQTHSRAPATEQF